MPCKRKRSSVGSGKPATLDYPWLALIFLDLAIGHRPALPGQRQMHKAKTHGADAFRFGGSFGFAAVISAGAALARQAESQHSPPYIGEGSSENRVGGKWLRRNLLCK